MKVTGLVILLLGLSVVAGAIDPNDLSILGSFYTSINHQSSPLSWDTTSDLCSAKNSGTFNLVPTVGCNGAGKVISLILPSLALSGSIPSVLGGLTALQTLILGGNSFSGSLPPQLSTLTSLAIFDLSGNTQVTGSIPTTYGSLTSLQTLNAASTGVSGQLPTQLGLLKNLNTLSLGGTKLTSSIPTEFGNLASLVNFFGSGAGFFGSIPSQLATATNLEQLDLDSNPFLGGPIPTEIGLLAELNSLDLHSCSFVTLPTELGNLVNLGLLDLSSNNLTGTIPTQLSSLIYLDTLKLSHNKFTGSIAPILSNLESLSIMDLSFNQLTGPIPTSFSSFPYIAVLNLVAGNTLCPVFDFSSYAPQTDYSPQNCNACAPSPCQNGGVCTYTTTFGCSCAPGFNGPACANHITCSLNFDGNATWPPTFAQSTANGSCNSLFAGQPTRTCDVNGNWGNIINSCISYCLPEEYGHVLWNYSAPNTLGTGACDSGYSGTPARQCSPTGVWSSNIKTQCNRNSCPTVFEGYVTWASSLSLNLQTATCPQYFTGSPRRLCLANGTWDVIQQPCVPITCGQMTYQNASWPTTNATLTATGVCATGFFGSPTRTCSPTGVWNSIVNSPCTQLSCSSEPSGGYAWPSTLPLQNVTLACPANYSGSVFRNCNGTGSWEAVINSCVGFCPGYNDSTTSWPTTNATNPASGLCLPGYAGTPSRQCISAGVWGAIQNACQPTACPDDTTSLIGNATWTSVPAGTTGNGTCLPGYSGSPTRNCLANGNWASTFTTGCPPIYCPAAIYGHTNFSATLAGTTSNGTCVLGYSGYSTRPCFIDGTWSSNIVFKCTVNTCPTVTEAFVTWSQANAGSTQFQYCSTGNNRSQRTCGLDGVWGPITKPCTS